MGCPEDTDQKRVARFFLYNKTKQLWDVNERPPGSTLVLAGREAAEVGCLRHYLKTDPRSTFFVDEDQGGLKAVKNQWPEAQIFHGPVEDAIASLNDSISLINLDFCGYLNHRAIISVEESTDKISEFGVVSYTFCRDRESAGTPSWAKVLDAAKKEMKGSAYKNLQEGSTEWLDAARFLGYTKLLLDILGKSFQPVFSMKYYSTRAMGVLMFQKIPPHKMTPRWRDVRDGIIAIGGPPDARAKLRDLAMSLTDTLSTKEVASILHLPAATLAAWQAHKTRGTYA